MEPPPFEETSATTHMHDSLENLPTYTDITAPRHTEHRDSLFKGSRPWLTLFLNSKARKPEDPPYFFGHAPITGRVEFDLVKPEYFVGVSLLVEGRMSNSVNYFQRHLDGYGDIDRAEKFMSQSHDIWKSRRASSLTDRLRKREGDRLCGRQTFDFSLQLPHFVEWKDRTANHNMFRFALPTSYAEKGSRVRIIYNITLFVQRGTVNSNDKITKQVLWQPVIQPPPMSIARQVAYSNGVPNILGPEEDPRGWHILDVARITGHVFGQRYVEAEYTLSLAKPLSYTRGSIIPVSLLVKCEDEQALHLLSTPSAISVKLVRNKQFYPSTETKEKDQEPTMFFQVMQGASWWEARDPNDSLARDTRHLVGEIHVNPVLRAAFTLPDCKFFYTVTLFAPDLTGFELSKESTQGGNPKRLALRSQEVELATVYAVGATRPIPVTAAMYDRSDTWSATDVLGKNPHPSDFTFLRGNLLTLRRIQSLDLA